MRDCITLPVFGTDVLLMHDLFGQSMKPGVALFTYHLPGMKTTDDSGLTKGETAKTGCLCGLDFGDDCDKEQERLLMGSMSCLVQFVVLLQ